MVYDRLIQVSSTMRTQVYGLLYVLSCFTCPRCIIWSARCSIRFCFILNRSFQFISILHLPDDIFTVDNVQSRAGIPPHQKASCIIHTDDCSPSPDRWCLKIIHLHKLHPGSRRLLLSQALNYLSSWKIHGFTSFLQEVPLPLHIPVKERGIF